MSGLRDRGPAPALARALKASACGFGVAVTINDVATRPWCSATFAGERCRVSLEVSGGRVAEWLDSLPEADLPLPGWYVADLIITSTQDGVIELQALVLEDA